MQHTIIKITTKTVIMFALLAVCRCGRANNVSGDVSSTIGEPNTAEIAAPASVSVQSTTQTKLQPDGELQLPDVPLSLREPSERAAYILEHFWDAMEFTDTLRSHSSEFMEQAFSNFISVFPYADEQARRISVETLMKRAEADSTSYVLLTDIAEKYLYDPNSPMLNEEYYILFLEQIVSSPVLGEYGTVRPRWQLEAARKNRPGMIAANFAYNTPSGRRTTLNRASSSERMLLIFYDPDCGHCQEILTALWEDELLAQMIADGEMDVLAIYSGEERELWEQTLSHFPDGWKTGYESGKLQENGTYVLRAMPTIYLLDKDKRVVLKDVPASQLLQMIHYGI